MVIVGGRIGDPSSRTFFSTERSRARLKTCLRLSGAAVIPGAAGSLKMS
jgi:hypothetical protein